MRLDRRAFIAGSATTIATLGAARAQKRSSVLRFIPQADLLGTDPHFIANYVTRNHAYLVFDTLYGLDAQLRPSPQMVEGHSIEHDGKLWRLTLRPSMTWHDGEKVLAKDCVASIKRWGSRDSFGTLLLAATDEVSAVDDRTIQFRLKKPFPRLPDALAKANPLMPAMMPERLANTPPSVAMAEVVGSGPFRFLATERVPGSRVVYAKYPNYIPRPLGAPDRMAGPKVALLDRVEWQIIPDAATAAAAMRAGECDWWEYVAPDLTGLMRGSSRLSVALAHPDGSMMQLRLNHRTKPFDNPKIRRALLGALDQKDYMQAIVGDDPTMYTAPIGFFTPGRSLANSAGMEILAGPRDLDRSRRELKAAGYANERVALMVPQDLPPVRAMADVGAEVMRSIGFNIDYQAMDWATLSQRRTKQDPVEKGGWSCFFTGGQGFDCINPIVNAQLVSNPAIAFYGWPDSPEVERLRLAWLDAEDERSEKRIAEDLQRQAFSDVVYIPLGQYKQLTAYNKALKGVSPGFPLFWGVSIES